MVANSDPMSRISKMKESLSALLRTFGGWEEVQSSPHTFLLEYNCRGIVFLRVGLAEPGGELFMQFGEISQDAPPLGFPLELGDLISIGRPIRRGIEDEPEDRWLCSILKSAACDVLSCDTQAFQEMRAKRLSLISADRVVESDRQTREMLARYWAEKDYRGVVESVRELGDRAFESEKIKAEFASRKLF